MPKKPTKMLAKYATKCKYCNDKVEVGEIIQVYDDKWYHVSCQKNVVNGRKNDITQKAEPGLKSLPVTKEIEFAAEEEKTVSYSRDPKSMDVELYTNALNRQINQFNIFLNKLDILIIENSEKMKSIEHDIMEYKLLTKL